MADKGSGYAGFDTGFSMTAPRDMFGSWPVSGSDPELTALQTDYLPDRDHLDLEGLMRDERLGRICVVSSFGAESAVLLHRVSIILPGVPVLFLDTGKHFLQTLLYRDALAAHLDLNLEIVSPRNDLLASEDAKGDLFLRDPDACCTLRKTMPLQDALAGYDTWVSGRKRFQSGRGTLPILERDGSMIKINPLALWTHEQIENYMVENELPKHPLVSQGFLSIGCEPCTRAVKPGEDLRAGRWAHVPEKSECGIHLGPDGRFVRSKGGSA